MADVYRSGIYPHYLPVPELAEELYTAAARYAPDPALRSIATSKLAQCRLVPLESDTSSNDNSNNGMTPKTPETPGRAVLGLARVHGPRMDALRTRDDSHDHAAAASSSATAMQPAEWMYDTGADDPQQAGEQWALWEDATTIRNNARLPAAAATTAAAAVVVMGDTQSSHDHAVVKSVSRTLQALKTKQQGKQRNDAEHQQHQRRVEEEVRATIIESDDMTAEAKANAMTVLDSICDPRTDTAIRSVGDVSPKQALTLVWGAIDDHISEDQQQPHDHERQLRMRETVAKQLASAVEWGNVVCAMGKMTRIVGALDGTDAAVCSPTKDIGAVREEMAFLASKVRDEVLKSSSAEDVAKYSRGGGRLDQDMRAAFRARAIRQYVDGLGMNAAVVEPLIAELELHGF